MPNQRRETRQQAAKYGESFYTNSVDSMKPPLKTRAKLRLAEFALAMEAKAEARSKEAKVARLQKEAAKSRLKQAVIETGSHLLGKMNKRTEQTTGVNPQKVIDKIVGTETDFPRKHADRDDPRYKDDKDSYSRQPNPAKTRKIAAIAMGAAGLIGTGNTDVVTDPIVEPAKAVYGYLADAVDESFDNNNLPPGGEPAEWRGGVLVNPETGVEIPAYDPSGAVRIGNPNEDIGSFITDRSQEALTLHLEQIITTTTAANNQD